MHIEHAVKPVTYMKKNAAELRQAALLLRLLTQGEADVRRGRVVSQGQAFRGVRAALRRK